MTIYINNLQKAIKINKLLITKILKSVLSQEGYHGVSVSLTIVNNKEIKRLNRQYLGKNQITDVISFPLASPLDHPADNLIGEIVVSAEKARQEAYRRHIPVQQELILYCIHGLLHLVGYNDVTRKKRVIMQQKQEKILKQWINISDFS